MRAPWAICAVMCGVALGGIAPGVSAQSKGLVGRLAPGFSLKDGRGATWSLAALKGKKVAVLDFGATRCLPCQATVKDLQAIHLAYKDRGVQVLTICVDATSAPTVRDFVAAQKLTYPVLIGGDLKAARAYGVQTIPFTVIVQKSGYVQWALLGHPEDYATQVRTQLDKLLAAR